jgi:hypothetical protein
MSRSRIYTEDEINYIKQSIDAGINLEDIAKTLGSARSWLSKWLKKNGIERSNGVDIDLLFANADEFLTIKELARKVNIPYDKVRYAVKKYNIPHLSKEVKERTAKPVRKKFALPQETIDDIIDRYTNKRQSLKDIAEFHKTTDYRIKNILVSNGVTILKKQKGIVKTFDKKTKRTVTRYWLPLQEEMMVKYLSADHNTRNFIFEKYLYYPIKRMADIISKKYFYGNIGSDYDHTVAINDAVSHLALKLNKFNPSKINSKNGGFSFCQTVIKNFYHDYFNTLSNKNKRKERAENTFSFDNTIINNESLDKEISDKLASEGVAYDEDEKQVAIQILETRLSREKNINKIKLYLLLIDMLQLGVEYNKYFLTHYIKIKLKLSYNEFKSLMWMTGFNQIIFQSPDFYKISDKIYNQYCNKPLNERILSDMINAFNAYEDDLHFKKHEKKVNTKRRNIEQTTARAREKRQLKKFVGAFEEFLNDEEE